MDNRKLKWLPWLLIVVVISLGLNIYFLLQHRGRSDDSAASITSEVLYTCPMHPTILQDHPGDCPICGMKLVKVSDGGNDQGSEAGGDVEGRAVVTIEPKRQQLIGLRTAPVTRGNVGGGWFTVGRVEADPTRVSKINVKVSGYIEQVFVDFVGRSVQRGEKLFAFYSPDLFAAQQEYLLALNARDTLAGDDLLVSAVRQKLKLWDVTDAQIKHLEETGKVTRALTFASPVTGVVTVKNVVEGSALNPGDIAYEVTDLSTVWVIAAAYQTDLARVKVGMPASIGFESLPDQVFTGKVAFIEPVLDPESRTLNVRLNLENKDGELKPGMFGEVLFRDVTHQALTIPSDAVIPSGKGNYVFVAIGNGEFEPREVILGQKSGDQIEVVEGLSEGELVVTRANFLVDSESLLRAALAAVQGS